MIIGLTGGIATGKSSVSNILKRLDQVVVDSDLIARQVVEPGQSAYHQIIDYFGAETVLPNGELNRAELGKRVFSNSEERRVLEEIIHPAVFTEIDRQVLEAQNEGHRMVFLDVPLLIETGMHNRVDQVVVVYTSPETQIRRLMERDHIDHSDAIKRISAQMPIDEKRNYADMIIDNNGSMEHLEAQVEQMLKRLQTGDI